MQEIFTLWNHLKQKINGRSAIPSFRERDVFYAHLGQNIGHEQNGKGDDFRRPILIFCRFNKHCFLGIPLTTTKKNNPFYFEMKLSNQRKSFAVLSQIRMIDARRLVHKTDRMSGQDFRLLKQALKNILKL